MRLDSIAVVGAVFTLTVAVQPMAAQRPGVPGDESLLVWLGLEVGDGVLYEADDGERTCVRIGEPRAIGGREFAPLQGMRWPGLASDSQILLPLDGTLGVDVIRTPGPRPLVRSLLEAEPDSIWRPTMSTPASFLTSAAIVADGWHGFGDREKGPTWLVYVWCRTCMDAGHVIWLERGRGIARVERTTIAGSESLARVDEPCTPPEVEFQLYIEVAPER